jgi:hypothetical protein
MSWLQHFIVIHSIYKYAGMFTTVTNIQEAIALVIRYHIKSEIIGKWLYCFTTPLIGFQLESIGFWYSFKHNAFVYTGNPKEGPASYESLNSIRERLGSKLVKGAINV